MNKEGIKDYFSKIPNIVFLGEKDENNKSNEYKTNIINTMQDDTIILIIHNLYLLTNRVNTVTTTINYLLSKCNYCINTKNVNKFKNILEYLKSIKLINYTDKEYKSIDMLEIDTTNLNIDSNFTILTQLELNTIILNAENKKELYNMLKIFLYIKLRSYKRSKGDYNICIAGGKAQTTYISYNNISKYTNVSEGNISKYIDKLKNIKLIDFRNLGKKFIASDKDKKLIECSNLYLIPSIIGEELINAEFKEGLKQQKYFYEQQGYTITKKEYVNNNRVINGRKGYLTKKVNNNTITKEEEKELNILIEDIEIYKSMYMKKGKIKK